MKPIIIIMDKNQTFSKEEIEKLIESAYESGYEDGRRSVNINIPANVPVYPLTYPWNEPYYRQPWYATTTSTKDFEVDYVKNISTTTAK